MPDRLAIEAEEKRLADQRLDMDLGRWMASDHVLNLIDRGLERGLDLETILSPIRRSVQLLHADVMDRIVAREDSFA